VASRPSAHPICEPRRVSGRVLLCLTRFVSRDA
jgi:hypothetical protein